MTWLWIILILGFAGLMTWVGHRQRRHAGDGTIEGVKQDAIRRNPDLNGDKSPGGGGIWGG